MKILVPLKRVADPDNANKVRVTGDSSKVDIARLDPKPNPFDEYAIETALRLTENGAQPKTRNGEIIVVTIGTRETERELRAMLATGADRAVRIDAEDGLLDGHIVAQAIKTIVSREQPDYVIMGKQAVDGDTNQVGQILAELLGWPMATSVATITEENNSLTVGREVDGGVAYLKLTRPAVITVDLRIVAPTSVYSCSTNRDFRYNDGVRYAPLPAIAKAKKKPIDVLNLAEVVTDTALRIEYRKFEQPKVRQAGVRVSDVAELVSKLIHEAKVIP